jgi:hypothetical protein
MQVLCLVLAVILLMDVMRGHVRSIYRGLYMIMFHTLARILLYFNWTYVLSTFNLLAGLNISLCIVAFISLCVLSPTGRQKL